MILCKRIIRLKFANIILLWCDESRYQGTHNLMSLLIVTIFVSWWSINSDFDDCVLLLLLPEYDPEINDD